LWTQQSQNVHESELVVISLHELLPQRDTDSGVSHFYEIPNQRKKNFPLSGNLIPSIKGLVNKILDVPKMGQNERL
jgi:hypothetical protein